MKPLMIIATGLVAASFHAPPASGQSADILLNCSNCHVLGSRTADRTGTPNPYPDLNGQPARYISHQLQAFRSGLRIHPQMQQTALWLDQGDAAMARMYADAPAPDLIPGHSADHQQALALITQGDWDRGLPPCSSCHTLDRKDHAPMAPRLQGQPRVYLGDQLRAYASGVRKSDPMARMRAYAERLTPGEISALAAYYADWQSREESRDD